MITGIILLLAIFGDYISKVYDAINIGSSYIKDMLIIIVKKSLTVLSISGVGLVLIGAILRILSKANIWKRTKSY